MKLYSSADKAQLLTIRVPGSARKTGGALCIDLQGNIGSQGFILGVNFEDLFAALDVRKAHIDLKVKTARA